MAAALRSAATAFLRKASVSGDMPFLAPLMCGSANHFLVGSVPIAINPLELAPSLTPTLGEICTASWRISATTLPRFLAVPEQCIPRSSVRKVLLCLGATSLVASVAYEDGSTTESYICMEGSGDQRILELEDEVKAEKEKNHALRKEIGLLKLGEELEKARIRSKRFLGWQLIVRESKGGGSGGPKKKTRYQWAVFFLEGPRNLKGFLEHHRENSKGWIGVVAILSVVPKLTWDDLKNICRQLIAGDFLSVYDSFRQLFGPKKLPLPLLYCDCGSCVPPVPICASCGLLVRPSRGVLASKEEARISPKGGKEDAAGGSPNSGKEDAGGSSPKSGKEDAGSSSPKSGKEDAGGSSPKSGKEDAGGSSPKSGKEDTGGSSPKSSK